MSEQHSFELYYFTTHACMPYNYAEGLGLTLKKKLTVEKSGPE